MRFPILPLLLSLVACQPSPESSPKALPFACSGPHVSNEPLVAEGARYLAPELAQVAADGLETLVVLGDSYSDTGRLGRRTFDAAVPRCVFWENRYSNGPVWADYVTGGLGWDTRNYAVSGAETRLESKASGWFQWFGYLNPFALHATMQDVILDPVLVQVEQLRRDDEREPLNRERTLVTLWIGTNNYWKHGKEDERDGRPDPQRVQARVEQVTADIDLAIKHIRGMGFQRLVLVNLAELGGLHQPIDLPKMASDATNHAYTLQHNQGLAVLRQRWDAADFRVALMDAYSLDKQAREQPETLGFASKEPCYWGYVFGFSRQTVCEAPLEHKLWDRLHPSTGMHCAYAVEFLQTLEREAWISGLDRAALQRKCRF